MTECKETIYGHIEGGNSREQPDSCKGDNPVVDAVSVKLVQLLWPMKIFYQQVWRVNPFLRDTSVCSPDKNQLCHLHQDQFNWRNITQYHLLKKLQLLNMRYSLFLWIVLFEYDYQGWYLKNSNLISLFPYIPSHDVFVSYLRIYNSIETCLGRNCFKLEWKESLTQWESKCSIIILNWPIVSCVYTSLFDHSGWSKVLLVQELPCACDCQIIHILLQIFIILNFTYAVNIPVIPITRWCPSAYLTSTSAAAMEAPSGRASPYVQARNIHTRNLCVLLPCNHKSLCQSVFFP